MTVVVMSQLCSHGYAGKQGSPDFRPQRCLVSRLHIHFAEHFGEQFHAVVVVNGHKLVVLLLCNLVAHPFAVDDGGHLVCSLLSGRFHTDIIYCHLSAMPSFAVPTFIGTDCCKVIAVHHHALPRQIFS